METFEGGSRDFPREGFGDTGLLYALRESARVAGILARCFKKSTVISRISALFQQTAARTLV